MLQIGVTSLDITPPPGTPLAGSCALRASQRVLDRLFAKILILEQDGQRYAILSADLLGFDERMTTRLRQYALRQHRIGMLLCCASHTHSGPDAYNEFQLYNNPHALAARRRYQVRLEKKLQQLISRGARRMHSASLSCGHGRVNFGINRRLKVGGEFQMMPNPKGFHDKTVSVFRFATASGKPLAILFSHACHPTTRYANEVSADYPGVAQRLIERQTGAVALFLQGACGEIRPNVTRIKSGRRCFVRGTQADVDRCGGMLARETLRVLDHQMKKTDTVLAAEESLVNLPFDRLPTEEDLRRFRECHKDHNLYRIWSDRMLRRVKRGNLPTHLPMQMILLRLSARHAFLAASHELCNAYVPKFQQLSKGVRLTVLGYTNACRAYIPDRKIRLEGGYEGRTSIRSYGLPSPFHPSVEKILIEACRELLHRGWSVKRKR